jgi:hypothetical protein
VLTLTLWLPGVVAHELTHALTAHRWAAWSLDWDAIATEFEWESGHPAPRLATYIAPLVLGSALTVGTLAAVAGQPGITVSAGVVAYAGVNLAVYTIASVADLVGAINALAAWTRGQTFATTE